MHFSNEDLKYLSGEKFSDLYLLQLGNNPTMSRLEYLMKLTRNKRILHIGCCDHIPIIMDKIKSKTWLHGLLIENCSLVDGVDINAEAIKYVIDNVLSPPMETHLYHADITDGLPPGLKNAKYDYALFGEIIEHLDNPVLFLGKIKEQLKNTVDKIIITVPYAHGMSQMVSTLFKKECINSDHRYWFSPYTIAKICVEAGIYPEELLFCSNPPFILKLFRRMKNKLHLKDVSCLSTFSNGLILIGSLNKVIS